MGFNSGFKGLKQSYQISTKQRFSNGALQKCGVPKNERKGSTRKFLLQYDSENLNVIIFINFTWNNFYFHSTAIHLLRCMQNCLSVTTNTTTFQKKILSPMQSCCCHVNNSQLVLKLYSMIKKKMD